MDEKRNITATVGCIAGCILQPIIDGRAEMVPIGRGNIISNMLKIKNVEKTDEGQYVCWAQNDGGRIQRAITFLVKGKMQNVC